MTDCVCASSDASLTDEEDACLDVNIGNNQDFDPSDYGAPVVHELPNGDYVCPRNVSYYNWVQTDEFHIGGNNNMMTFWVDQDGSTLMVRRTDGLYDGYSYSYDQEYLGWNVNLTITCCKPNAVLDFPYAECVCFRR